MLATLDDQGVHRPGLAVRDQVGRLPRPGRRRRRQGQDVDPQPEGRRDLLPGTADVRRPGSTRAQAIVDGEVVALDDEGRPDFSLLQERTGTKHAPNLVLPGVRPAVPRWAAAARRRPRGPQAPAQERAAAASACPLRGPRRRARARRSTTPPESRSSRASSPSSSARATSRDAGRAPGSRSRSGPSRSSSSAAGRPGTGNARGPRGARGRRVRGRQAAVQRQGRLRVRPHRTAGVLLDASCAARGRRAAVRSAAAEATIAAAGAATCVGVTWVRPELVIRAELGGWSRDGMVRQSAFKGIEAGRDPTTVAREHAVATASAIRDAESEVPAIGGRHADVEIEAEVESSRSRSRSQAAAAASPSTRGRRPTPSSPPSTRSARKASGRSAATTSR